MVIDINHRGQVHIDAECLEFVSCRQRYLVSNFLRTDSSQCHIAWKYGARLPKPLHNTVFLVNRDEQRVAMSSLLRDPLSALGKLKYLAGIANITRKQDDVPNVVGLNQVDNL